METGVTSFVTELISKAFDILAFLRHCVGFSGEGNSKTKSSRCRPTSAYDLLNILWLSVKSLNVLSTPGYFF